MSDVRLTGGCQCGAVRYALLKQPERPCICHCRMCQKASGNVFATWAGVEAEFFIVTRGHATAFNASDHADRCFCNQCGTPVYWRQSDGQWFSVNIGSLDEPERVKPNRFYGEEGRVSWTAEVAARPGTRTGGDDPHYENWIRQSNHQHPDHDTIDWVAHVGGIS